MLCVFERVLYRNTGDTSGFTIALYKPLEAVCGDDGSLISQIKAVGYFLPVSIGTRYDLQGKWKKNSKYGIQYEVENFREVITLTKEGIISYLRSGSIKGIGKKTAEKIYEKFGDRTLDILENQPERLICVSGISEKKMRRITESYQENREAGNAAAFLASCGIGPKKTAEILKRYGDETIKTVKENPYILCEIPGISFKTADKAAMQIGFDELSPMRIDEGIIYTLICSETAGNLCLLKDELIRQCIKKLNTPEITEYMISERIEKLKKEKRLYTYMDMYYRPYAAKAEHLLAWYVADILKSRKARYIPDLDRLIRYKEKELGISLSPEQYDAVKSALCSNISIITGGPGTGKTTVQKVILEIYRDEYPDREICCCAPTGRAARRLSESTSFTASTIHKVLKLDLDEKAESTEAEKLSADLILIDEASMLDSFIAYKLFSALKKGAQVVITGDSDQLPSVGPGAVLSELISSSLIPVVRLEKIFRQKEGSLIAKNSGIIKEGKYSLETGDEFCFIPSADINESAEILLRIYLDEIKSRGIENVALLSPLRQKTATGANNLNMLIRDKVNPAGENTVEISNGKRTFRLNDRVMQIRNFAQVNNGDIGVITDITRKGDEKVAHVKFECGIEMEYDTSELEMLELGYVYTVHKSQGAEFDTVLINIQNAHSVMLTRPLLYTAVTRSKKKVILVGDKKAVYTAISRSEVKKRGTCLAQILKDVISR